MHLEQQELDSNIIDDTLNDYNETLKELFKIKPIFSEKIRRKTLSLIEGRNSSSEVMNKNYCYFTNLYIPIIGLLILFIIAIFKRNIRLFLLTGMILGHTLLVFITAPAAYFMYYYNVYLIGLFLMFFYIIKFTESFKKSKYFNK